jgi:hypothetical protein
MLLGKHHKLIFVIVSRFIPKFYSWYWSSMRLAFGGFFMIRSTCCSCSLPFLWLCWTFESFSLEIAGDMLHKGRCWRAIHAIGNGKSSSIASKKVLGRLRAPNISSNYWILWDFLPNEWTSIYLGPPRVGMLAAKYTSSSTDCSCSL